MPNPPTQTISRFSVNGVAVDVGTRSRRRASQPKADQAARSAVRAWSANLPAAQGCAVWQAPASARSAGAFRRLRGALSSGYSSVREQRRVARRRAASGIIAVQASPQAITTALTLTLSQREREHL